MDADRFDRFVQSLMRPNTRRAALRALGAGGLGAGLAALGLREGALACDGNGKGCDQNQAEKCCSGTCEKKGGKFRCVKAKGAFGCKNKGKTDACEVVSEMEPEPCPNNPDGFCVVDEKKRPLCGGRGSECFLCNSDQDCRVETGVAKARCIKQCRACTGVNGNENTGGRACIVPPGSLPMNGTMRRLR